LQADVMFHIIESTVSADNAHFKNVIQYNKSIDNVYPNVNDQHTHTHTHTNTYI